MNMLSTAVLLSFILKGVVVDRETKKPVPYAALELIDESRGTYAERDGSFSLSISEKGIIHLKVSAIGYEAKTLRLRIRGDRTVRISLRPRAVRLEEIVVSPGRGTIDEDVGPGKGTMSGMDILMMPGSATDPFWALKTLPGTCAGTDNAVIALQGGNPEEIGVYVNGLRVSHPYHYEGSGGGLFSLIDESMVERAELYSAGYPADYGNALSGVLSVKTRNGIPNGQKSFEMSMAGMSLNLAGDNYNFLISRGYTEPIKSFFGEKKKFTLYPRTYDLQGSLGISPSARAHLSLFALAGWDATGVDLSDQGFEGEYRNNSAKGMGGAKITADLEGAALELSIGESFYRSETSIGDLWSFIRDEKELESRLVIEKGAGKSLLIRGGMDLRQIVGRYDAVLPLDSSRWRDPESPGDTVSQVYGDWEGGFFLSSKYALTGRLFLEAGLRGFLSETSPTFRLYPRVALAVVDSGWTLRFGGGLYGQAFHPFRPGSGRTASTVSRAIHGAVSLERNLNASFALKGELFCKGYRDLPVDENPRTKGRGRSWGAQFLVRKFNGNPKGWLSVTYLRSFRSADTTLREYRSDYDTPLIFSLVSQSYLGKGFSLGMKLRYATGRPYTPVTGARFESGGWVPLYGEINSSRYPYYLRADMRLTRFSTLRGYPFIIFLELLNVTNRRNVVAWTYSEDYFERKPVVYFRFMPVLGFVLIF